MTTAMPPQLERIESLSRKDSVVNAIRRAVIGGTLRPGDKLTEVSLASMLGVSRHTVREAINLLVLDGMLEQEPYKGLRVTELGPEDIRGLARTRQSLDLLAVTSILEDTTGRRMEMFVQGWDAFAKVAFDPDPLVGHEGHTAFHRQMWVAAENSVLLRMWPVVQAQATIALAQDQAIHADPQRDFDLHQRLVDVIRGGDLTAIEAELNRHTIESAEDVARSWTHHES